MDSLSLKSFSTFQVGQTYKALSQNPLVKRVISIFDKDKDGKISFVEFITGLATLSTTADEKAKLLFAFKVYDRDEDGFISNGDLFGVCYIDSGSQDDGRH